MLHREWLVLNIKHSTPMKVTVKVLNGSWRKEDIFFTF